MSAAIKDLFEVNALRLAHEFVATLSQDRSAAIKLLKANLSCMEEWELRQWTDYMGEIVIEEDISAEQLQTILQALEFLDHIADYPTSSEIACHAD